MRTTEIEYERPPVIDGSGRMGRGAFIVNGERFEFDGSPSDYSDEGWDEHSAQIASAHSAAMDRAQSIMRGEG